MGEKIRRFVESSVLELKEIVVQDIRKEVIAFANTNGGTLFVGITDDGRVIGIGNADTEMQQVTNMIRDAVRPDITMFIEYNIEEIDGKEVIRIDIQKGTHAPYYLHGKGIRPEGVFVRQGTSAVPASEAAIRKMIKESDGDNFEMMRSLNQELTFSVLKQEFDKRAIAFGSQQMVTLGIKNAEGLYTNLGVLLSDECRHTIKAAVFDGMKKTDFQDRREFSGSLLKQMNDVYEFICLNNKTKALFAGLQRIDRHDYPEVAVREALLNSLVHREYSFSGSTLISIFSDRIEFVSMGGLVNGLTLDDIMLGISQCRNEKMAALFYRLKLIEAYGTGVPKIIECYAEESVKPEFEKTDNAFKIILPNRNFKHSVDFSLSGQEEVVVDFMNKQGKFVRKDVEKLLAVSASMAGRIIKRLVEKELIISQGNGKNRYYIGKKDS